MWVSDPKECILPSQTLEPAVDGHTQEIETCKERERKPQSFQEDNYEMGEWGANGGFSSTQGDWRRSSKQGPPKPEQTDRSVCFKYTRIS